MLCTMNCRNPRKRNEDINKIFAIKGKMLSRILFFKIFLLNFNQEKTKSTEIKGVST